MTSVFVAGLLALIEDVSTLSVILSSLATASFVIVMTASEASSWQRQLLRAALVPLRGPFQLLGDIIGALRHMKKLTPEWLGSLVAWIVPLLHLRDLPVSAVVGKSADRTAVAAHRSHVRCSMFCVSWRTAFWITVVCAIWPLMHRRTKRKAGSASHPGPIADTVRAFGHSTICLARLRCLRSLILFNLLFALQSVLDLTYLWGDRRLPNGMSHAAICPSRRLSADRHGTARRRLRADRDAARRTGGELSIDPSAGAGVDRAKHPAGDLVDLPARSLYRRVLPHLSAARGLHLDGAGRDRDWR